MLQRIFGRISAPSSLVHSRWRLRLCKALNWMRGFQTVSWRWGHPLHRWPVSCWRLWPATNLSSRLDCDKSNCWREDSLTFDGFIVRKCMSHLAFRSRISFDSHTFSKVLKYFMMLNALEASKPLAIDRICSLFCILEIRQVILSLYMGLYCLDSTTGSPVPWWRKHLLDGWQYVDFVLKIKTSVVASVCRKVVLALVPVIWGNRFFVKVIIETVHEVDVVFSQNTTMWTLLIGGVCTECFFVPLCRLLVVTANAVHFSFISSLDLSISHHFISNVAIKIARHETGDFLH